MITNRIVIAAGFSLRIHRIYTSQPLEPGCEVDLEKGAAHYLGRVLRATPGQAVVLFNGDSHDYAAEVAGVTKKGVSLAVRSRLPAVRESWLKLIVVQAVSRGERMDQTLQKCTELGAVAFQPLLTERVEVRLVGDKLARRLEHWQGVVISACEQSGRAVIPEVRKALPLPEWLGQEPAGRRFLLDPCADLPISSADIPAHLELAIGPEGGFSNSELKSMHSAGVVSLCLGPRVLRTETAAPAAVAVLQSMAGDF
jgi:16S rRNA (uracil1498-N3)-methyltransferase